MDFPSNLASASHNIVNTIFTAPHKRRHDYKNNLLYPEVMEEGFGEELFSLGQTLIFPLNICLG